MTAIVIKFRGRPEQSARQNLDSFIAHAKLSMLFRGENKVNWSDDPWDLEGYYQSLQRHARTGQIVHFTNYDTTRRGNRQPNAVQIQHPFIDQARALLTEYITTSREKAPSKFVAILRLIEKSFEDLGRSPDVCEIDNDVLNRAAAILSEKGGDTFTMGRLLGRLVSEILEPGRLTTKRLSWQSPFSYVAPVRNDKVNAESTTINNADKLPHLKCILDLAGVFHASSYPPDQVVTAWFALSMFAPERIDEVLSLSLKAETESQGIYGLSWVPRKGGAPMTKFAVNPEWADLAREAFSRLKKLGAKCRIAAAWYEKNPTKIYLPAAYEHLRGQPVTLWEAGQIVGRQSAPKVSSSLRNALVGTGTTTRDMARGAPEATGQFLKLFSFDSLEQWALGALPEGFPFISGKQTTKASEAVFCLPQHIMRGDGETAEYVPDFITYSQIQHELGSKPTGKTIFSRHELRHPVTGDFWKMNSHQPRHFLNTLAQSKFVSQELIAFWSGRKSVRQNDYYNHLPQEVFIELYARTTDEAIEINVDGPLKDKASDRARLEGISYDDALRLELGSIISTRYGLCRHNFAVTPCPRDKNCIGCGEITFIKGRQEHLDEAQAQLAIYKKATVGAENATSQNRYGAQNWLEKNREKRDRWELVVEKLTDPSIPAGTLITLDPPLRGQTKAGLADEVRSSLHNERADDLELADGDISGLDDFLNS